MRSASAIADVPPSDNFSRRRLTTACASTPSCMALNGKSIQLLVDEATGGKLHFLRGRYVAPQHAEINRFRVQRPEACCLSLPEQPGEVRAQLAGLKVVSSPFFGHVAWFLLGGGIVQMIEGGRKPR